MAEKEQIICIFELKGIAKESYCGWSMTRTEAIEKMAKALFEEDTVFSLDIPWEKLPNRRQTTYRRLVKPVLDALLEAKNEQ